VEACAHQRESEDRLGTPQGCQEGKKDLKGKSWMTTGSRGRSNWRILNTLLVSSIHLWSSKRSGEALLGQAMENPRDQAHSAARTITVDMWPIAMTG
jgi:hypothetical protein